MMMMIAIAHSKTLLADRIMIVLYATMMIAVMMIAMMMIASSTARPCWQICHLFLPGCLLLEEEKGVL